jgi:hypothetical protein
VQFFSSIAASEVDRQRIGECALKAHGPGERRCVALWIHPIGTMTVDARGFPDTEALQVLTDGVGTDA